ncbi:MAG: DUF6088 family protein [Candidatus Margulisbacteria bacterium]|jgi:hypothetical protein|nr:DUF6088 family protein [Candidatus Margulisiibacteriota bacterium]
MARRLYNGNLTVEDRILARINRSRAAVFVPKDFQDISSYPQVLRALKQLVKDRKIVRFGYGSYAKAKINPFDNRCYPAQDMVSVVRELFDKLGIDWDYSQAVKDYNLGLSMQMPMKNFFVLNTRFNRNLKGAEELYA